MKNVDWGWQGKARKLRMRGEYLWEHMPIPADVVFHVPNKTGGIEEIPAHKLMLGIGSQVFYAMFYGPNAATKTGEDITIVSIPNYTADVFEVVLRFLYSDRVRIPRTARIGSSWKQWMDVLVCADQYGIVELSTKCRQSLCDALEFSVAGYDLSDAGLTYVLMKAEEIGDLEIVQAATRAVVQEGKKFLQLPERRVSFEFLCQFIKLNQTQLEAKDEIRIYQAVRTWAQREQATEVEQGLPRRILRDILGPIFEGIRFPLMSSVEIAEGPVKDGMFTLEEITALYQQQFSTDVAKPRPFLDGLRKVKHPLRRGQLEVQVSLASNNINGTLGTPFDIAIQPFTDGVATTVDKFLRLCAENYQFAVLCEDELIVDIASSAERFPGSRLTAKKREKLIGLVISEVEKQVYVHDSAGTVALLWNPNAMLKYGGRFTLDISVGKSWRMAHLENDLTYDGIVFGRVTGDSYEALQTLRCLKMSMPVPLEYDLTTSVAVIE